ncbi:MAG TPA: lipocalin family protein [Flavobacterium sp.]|nr:lipocalin family protein [Flavobacterium sp.]
MKRIPLLLLAMAGCLALACNDDDDNNTDISGTYNLTAFMAPVAVDFNDDGTPSTNLINETTCYDNATLVLHDNATYDLTYSYLTVQDDAVVTSCQNSVTSGTWARSGSSVVLTDGVSSDTSIFTYSQNTLSQVQTGVYPNINSEGDAYLATGTVGIVFTEVE